jgi:predicted nucleic-acid-binding Zn-ribbon protein
MRTTATCPKCSGKKVIVAELRHRNAIDDNMERIDRVPVVGFVVPGFLTTTINFLGRFESWICAACGYTEFYAKDLGDVDALAAKCPEEVRIVDSAAPKKGPFR